MQSTQAQQVWQRVHPGGAMELDLPGLWKLVRSQQSIFRQLSPLGEGARELESWYDHCGQVLRGMLTLSGKAGRPEGLPPLPRMSRQRLLELAFQNSRSLALSYTGRSALGDFGCAFQALARLEGEQQLSILALIDCRKS